VSKPTTAGAVDSVIRDTLGFGARLITKRGAPVNEGTKLRRRALAGIGIAAIAATGAAWSGCGDDEEEAEDAANELIEQAQDQADQIQEDVQQGVDEAQEQAQEELDNADVEGKAEDAQKQAEKAQKELEEQLEQAQQETEQALEDAGY
jgi:flagellar biosynthesis GTPase FlhF